MKNLLLSLLLLAVSLSAQSQNNINVDTAKANRLYEEAMSALPIITDDINAYMLSEAEKVEQRSDIPVIHKLEAAIRLLDKYPVSQQKIYIKSDLAYLYHTLDYETALEFGLQTIEEALTNNIDSFDHCLFKSYFTMCLVESEYEFYDLDNAEKAYLTASPISDDYLSFQTIYLTNVIHSGKKQMYEERVALFKTALEDPKSQRFTYGKVYYNQLQMSYYGYLLNNLDKSISYGMKTLLENEKYNVLDDEDLSMINYEIGISYIKLNKLNQAKSSFQNALTLTSSEIGKGLILLEMAMIESLNNSPKSIEYALQARDKFLKIEHRLFLHKAYGELAGYYYENGKLDLFKENMSESLKYGRNVGLLSDFGYKLGKIGAYQDGLELIQEVLVEFVLDFNSMEISDNPSREADCREIEAVGNALYIKSWLLYQQALENQTKKKKDLLSLSLATNDIASHILNKGMMNLNGFESSKLVFNKSLNEIFENDLLINYELSKEDNDKKYFNHFWKAMEQKKMATLRNNLTAPDLPPEVSTKQTELLKNKVVYELKLEVLKDKDSTDFYISKLINLNNELEKLEKEIIKNNPKQQFFRKNNLMDLAEIQAKLSNETLFVHYGFAGENDLFIMTISKLNYHIKQVKIDDYFSNNIKKVNQLLQDPLLLQTRKKNQFIDIAHSLYQHLILPIELELKTHNKIILSNDKELHYLPFEVLLSTDEIKPFDQLDFLIKKYDISYQYSATIYTQLKNKPTIRDKSLFAFAPVFNENEITGSTRNVDFLVDSLYRSVENNRFVALPNTKKEVQTIANTLGNKANTTILLEKKATKANYDQAIKGKSYQFAHIATHGLVNLENPKLSALACYTKTENIEKQLLFANEIQMQDIQADLVVLSSCESGIGQLIQGEGLIALNRSYIYAGANNVLFSLWKVSDKYSAELMINFYKSYMINNDYSMALQAAKLKMLSDEKTANPRYWAAFILIGE